MRSNFGHLGDFYEAMKETYEKCPHAKTKERLVEIADSVRHLEGTEVNLEAYWSGHSKLLDGILHPRGQEY